MIVKSAMCNTTGVAVSVFSMAEKLVKSQHLAHKLSQLGVDAMFPSSIMLLPPDIARQLGFDAPSSHTADVDTYVKVYHMCMITMSL